MHHEQATTFLALLLAASPSLVSAQRETDSAVKLPACVTTCYALAVARANCDTLNPSCICGSNAFFNGVRTCLQTRDGTCTEEEAISAWNILNGQCADKVSTAFPSLVFETDSIIPTMGTITPDPTESDSIVPTMGTITGPGESSESEAPTTMGSITGPGETSVTEAPTTMQTTTEADESTTVSTPTPIATTTAPGAAVKNIPSVLSIMLGSFVAGASLFYMM